MAQLIGGQHGEHVGLVLLGIDGPTQLPAGQPGVVAGGHRVEPQCQCAGRQGGELDSLVAPHAWVGGFPTRI